MEFSRNFIIQCDSVSESHILNFNIYGCMVDFIFQSDDFFAMPQTEFIKIGERSGGFYDIGYIVIKSKPVDQVQCIVKKMRINL